MTGNSLRSGSLVLYRGKAALVQRAADKLELQLEGGETAKVRAKDVQLLHEGPLRSLGELRPLSGDTETAWSIVAGSTVGLAELAELIYGASTPSANWAAWQAVAEGDLFEGTPERITAHTEAQVEQRRLARAAQRAEKEAWGSFQQRVLEHRFAPEDRRYLSDIEALALGSIDRGRVLRDLGRDCTPESAHALLLEVGFWTPSVNPYPSRLEVPTSSAELEVGGLPEEGRRDLTQLETFAIDDPTTDTPDDAISLDGHRLWVHVADVAAVVLPDSALDLEARGRAATLYLPELTATMLPASLTPQVALGLAEISPALSFGIDLEAQTGAVLNLEVVPSWIRVRRLTYESANDLLGSEPLASILKLTNSHRAAREERGAVSIDLPEVQLDARNPEVVIHQIRSIPSRSLVEEAMIMAGEAVARYGIEKNLPLPFSTQERTEDRRAPDNSLSSMYALRKTMRRSQYRTAPGSHAGLALAAYVQVTSPLRRYLDLVAHQQLRALAAGMTVLGESQLLERVGAIEAVIGNVRAAESLSNRHWAGVYLLQHPDWRGSGIVVDAHGASAKLLIPELALETQVHLPFEPDLDEEVPLELVDVDLPRLDARFRARR